MLNRNLWMIWPTGYYGSYIHWLINRAEIDLKHNTVSSPFFDNGSSHAHIKKPPHQTIEYLIQSMLRNKYPTGTIYPVGITSNVEFNSQSHNWMKGFENTLFWILRIEHEPVIINIYNNHNDYYSKIAAINMFNKENWVAESIPDDNGYYVFQDEDKLNARNYLVDNWKIIYPHQTKMLTADTVNLYRDTVNVGFYNRLKHESWEYNIEDNLIHAVGKHLYNIEISEILSHNFLKTLENILIEADIGTFDFTGLQEIHLEFLQRQQKYIEIANNMFLQSREKKYILQLDDNILYQALAIDTLCEYNVLPDNWKMLTLKEIVEDAKPK